MLLFSLDSYDASPLRSWQRPLVPLAITAVLGFVLPEILGGGNCLVDSLVTEHYGVLFLLLLLAGKFLFTMVCFGSGVPGGIFLPMSVRQDAKAQAQGAYDVLKQLLVGKNVKDVLLPFRVVDRQNVDDASK